MSSTTRRPATPAADPAGAPRRFRDDPLEVLEHLVDHVGDRPPASVAEARAAAYCNGRLRRAGMQVAIDTFTVVTPPGHDGIVLACCALVSVILAYWWPAVALIGAALTSLAAVVAALRRDPLLAPRRTSQNVIATRASTEAARMTVVVLMALDNPPPTAPWYAWWFDERRGRTWRAILAGLLVAATLTNVLDPRPHWWYAQGAFALLLAALAGIGYGRRRLRHDGRIQAGEFAAALLIAGLTQAHTRIELWIAGVGALSVGHGIDDLLQRYPFDPDTTLFVLLDGIAAGAPQATVAPGRTPEPGDALLVEVVAASGFRIAEVAGRHHRAIARLRHSARRRLLRIGSTEAATGARATSDAAARAGCNARTIELVAERLTTALRLLDERLAAQA
jgi:hypothetical protein